MGFNSGFKGLNIIWIISSCKERVALQGTLTAVFSPLAATNQDMQIQLWYSETWNAASSTGSPVFTSQPVRCLAILIPSRHMSGSRLTNWPTTASFHVPVIALLTDHAVIRRCMVDIEAFESAVK